MNQLIKITFSILGTSVACFASADEVQTIRVLVNAATTKLGIENALVGINR